MPYVSEDTGTIAPGMSEREVYSLWGAPAEVRRAGEYTYLFFNNGCERTCGTADVRDPAERGRHRRHRPLGRSPLFGRVVVTAGQDADPQPGRRHAAGTAAVSDKPSKNEDEYFARPRRELLRQQRASAQQAAAQNRAESRIT